MTHMLDTNICIFIIKQKPLHALERLQSHSLSDVGVSMITVAELVEFDKAAAEHYGEIRADLEQRGQSIGSMDMLIAAHGRSLGVTLVTNNLREFSRVPGLSAEDWTV